MDLAPFLEGFLEKLAVVKAVLPNELLQHLDRGELSQADRENISSQLRNRDWGRTLRGVALTGGGAAIGTGVGAGLRELIPESFWQGKPDWARMLPIGISSAAGGWLGRQLELALLDPIDRVYYRSPELLRQRLSSERWPILAPSEGYVPQFRVNPAEIMMPERYR